jgi:neutral ceramidase
MQAGFFATDITAPIGTMQAGDYTPQHLEGVAGPLKVRAAIFEQDGFITAFAGVDCCAISKEMITRALEFAREKGGLKIDHHIISASHTHSAAAVSPFFDLKLLEKADERVKAMLKNSPLPDTWYTDWVVRQLGTALIMAYRHLEPALINAGSGEEAAMIFNRRFFLKDGRTYTHPGRMNPDIVKAAGPIDPQVAAIGAWREDGTLIGCLVNYSCHGTTYSGHLAHGDWYHYAEETLQKLFGEQTSVVLLNGPCGDVTQVNNLEWDKGFGLDYSYRMGFRVAAEAGKVLVSAKKHACQVLAGQTEDLLATRRQPTPESLRNAWQTLERLADTPLDTDAIFARERLIAGELARLEPRRALPLTAIQVGDAVILSNPAEYFTSLGLRIKANSAFSTCMVVELANDCAGYVPDAAAFGRKTGGGYETILTGYSNLTPETGDLIADKLIKMAGKMTPEKIPAPPEREPGQLWDYGKRGPDLD